MTNKTRIAAMSAVAGIIASAISASALSLPTQSCSYSFVSTMRLGSRGGEVRNLQKVLNMYPQTQVSTSGAGSPGMETDYFGNATLAAVKKFQSVNGVSPVSGLVGPLTRAELNMVCSGTGTGTGSTTTTPPVAGPVSVSLAASQPTNTLVAGQAAARLADFTFSGNGTVTSVKLTRTGVSANTTLSNVYLFDGATRVAGPASVLSDGTVNFNSTSGLFTVNGSKTITVKSDIDNVTSQIVGVALTNYTVMGGTPAAVNVMGNNLSIASVALSTATLSGSQVSASNMDAGVMGKTVWSQTLNIGTREAKFQSMTVKMIGSAPVDSLSNISLFIDGVKFGQSTSVNSNYLATFTDAAKLLTTGNHTLEVRADVVKGSNRNFQFSLENPVDIMIEDRDVAGAYVTVTNSTNNAAGLITVNNGSLTISQDPAFTNTQVVGGATNVEIARYVVRAYGEDVKITSLTVTPSLTGSTPAAAGLNNVSLYKDGGQVGSSKAWTSGSLAFDSLGTSIVVPAGSSVVLAVKADMMTSGSVAYTAGTVKADLVLGSNNAQGMTSNQLVSTPAATGKNLTVSSASVTFGNTAGFVAQTINPNTNSVKVGSFTLQAGGAEGVRVTNLNVAVGGTAGLANIANLTVKDGSTTIGTPVGNVQSSNNFSLSVDVPVSGTKTYDVYVDVLGATAGTNVTVNMTATAQGLVANNSNTYTATVVTSPINTATVAAPTLKSSSPVAQYVTSGSTGKVQAVYNFVSSNGVSTINKILVGLSGNGYTSITVSDASSTVTKGLVAGATSILVDDLNISLPNSAAGKDVTITANFATVGNGGVTSNAANSVSIMAGGEYTTGNTTAALLASTASSNAQTLVGSTFTKVAATAGGESVGAAGKVDAKLGTVTVTAATAGPVALKALPVSASAVGTITNMKLKRGGSVESTATYAAGVFTWSTALSMSAGETLTFDVYGDVASNSSTNPSASSVSVSPSASFLWNDINGAANNLTGTLIFNYGN